MSDHVLRVGVVVAALVLAAVQALAAPVVHTERNNVHACLPLSGGRVLAGSRGGLVLLDRRGAVRQVWARQSGLPGTAVFALLQDGQRVWAGTERGLARLGHSRGKLEVDLTIPGPAVRDLALLGGRLYAATWRGAYSLEEGTTRLAPLPAAGRRQALRLTSVTAWAGALVFGSAGQGLWRARRGTLRPVKVSLPSPLVWSLARARDGRLYVGTLGGVVTLGQDGRATAVSAMDARALLPLGRELLMGGYGQGLRRLVRGRPVTEPGQPAARATYVNALARDHGVTCAGTRGGLWLRRGLGSFRRVVLPGPPSNDISALATQGGRLWVGTFDQGLASISGGRWRTGALRGDRIDGRINAMAVSNAERGTRSAERRDVLPPSNRRKKGAATVSGAWTRLARPGPATTPSSELRVPSSLWVATSRGVFRVRGQRVKGFGVAHGLPHLEVHTVLALRKGGILAGTARGAVIIRGEAVTTLGVKQGLPVASVWAAAEHDDGTLWIGTSKGLYRWFPRARRYERYSVSSGHLADDYVTALQVHGGAVYAGTYNSGVSRLTSLSGKVEATQLKGGWINFGGLRIHDGALYASTMTGLRTLPLTCLATPGGCAWTERPLAARGRDVTAVVPLSGGLWVASRRGVAFHQRW